jgi:hypothetical protein
VLTMSLKMSTDVALLLNTIDAYLHVHINMPVLSEFDVRLAVRALQNWTDEVVLPRRPGNKSGLLTYSVNKLKRQYTSI